MKVCPRCGREFGFFSFLLRCGSDTLIPHSPQGHRREHVCDHCRAKFWISYDHKVFQTLTRRYMGVSGLGTAVFMVLALNPLRESDPGRLLLLILIALFITIPWALTYAKYQSATLGLEA